MNYYCIIGLILIAPFIDIILDEDPSPGLDLVAKYLKEQDDSESVRPGYVRNYVIL